MIVRSNPSAKALLATVALLVTMAASPARAEMDDQCWPPGQPEYPVGLPDAVVSKASDFLLRAEGVPERPYWPGGKSDITIGAGWDVGYHTAGDLHKTWGKLDAEALGHLETAVGKRGPAAHALLGGLDSVTIPRSLSLRVLNSGNAVQGT